VREAEAVIRERFQSITERQTAARKG